MLGMYTKYVAGIAYLLRKMWMMRDMAISDMRICHTSTIHIKLNVFLNSIKLKSDGDTKNQWNVRRCWSEKYKNECGIYWNHHISFGSKIWNDDICMCNRIGLAVCRWICAFAGRIWSGNIKVNSAHIKTDTYCCPFVRVQMPNANGLSLHKLSICFPFSIRIYTWRPTATKVFVTDGIDVTKYRYAVQESSLFVLWNRYSMVDDVMHKPNK